MKEHKEKQKKSTESKENWKRSRKGKKLTFRNNITNLQNFLGKIHNWVIIIITFK